MKILFTWELGMGMGHLMQIKALARHFLQFKGYQIFLALQDVRRASQVFEPGTVTVLQAPTAKSLQQQTRAVTAYGQLLLINGYHDKEQVLGLCQSWQALYDLIKPELIMFDHSPTAMLAARGYDAKKVALGTSFTVPPANKPLGMWLANNLPQIEADEANALQQCNAVLAKMGKPAMQNLADIYREVDENAVLSLPEFDHFGARPELAYLGPAEHKSGSAKPDWPIANCKKIYVYVKPFKHLPLLLKTLCEVDAAIIVYTGDIAESVIAPYQAKHIRYESQPLNLEQVAKDANGAIINANHGTLMHFVLSKVPVLMLPLHQEQKLLADRMQQQGIGLQASIESPEQIVKSIHTLLGLENCSKAMVKLADNYQGFDANARQQAFCSSILQALTNKTV